MAQVISVAKLPKQGKAGVIYKYKNRCFRWTGKKPLIWRIVKCPNK